MSGCRKRRVEVGSERRVDVKGQADVGVDVHAFLRRERERLVDGASFVRRRRPHHVLHADRKLHDLLGERVVKNPTRHDGNVLHAARTSRELHANADVAGIDAGEREHRKNDRTDDQKDAEKQAASRTTRGPGIELNGF